MENIQEKMKEFFGGACYAYCLTKLFRPEMRLPNITTCILHGWDKGLIDDDGYVRFPIKYITDILGVKNYRDVKIVLIDSIDDIKDDIKEPTIVEYSYNGGSHFVIVKNGKVIFEPSGDSKSVKYGKPVSYREFLK